MRRKILVFVCVLVIALMVVSTVPVGAKKPPKDPPPDDDGGDPTGTIYYSQTDDVDGTSYWKMDADGGNKVELSDAVEGSISLEKHKDDHYWWFYFKELTTKHPDENFQTELWAVRDDGTGATKLWYDPDMVYIRWNGPLCWMSEDAYISWVTWKIASDGSISMPGIYKGSVGFGTDDNTPSLGTPVRVWDTGTWYSEGGDEWRAGGTFPNWTADMNKVIYNEVDAGKAIIDFSTTPATKTTLGNIGGPKFSPDGTKLACALNEKLYVMDADGTDSTVIASVRSSKKTWKHFDYVYWSPDSKYLTYSVVAIKVGVEFNSMSTVYTIGVDGSDNTKLTRATNTCDWFISVDWR